MGGEGEKKKKGKKGRGPPAYGNVRNDRGGAGKRGKGRERKRGGEREREREKERERQQASCQVSLNGEARSVLVFTWAPLWD